MFQGLVFLVILFGLPFLIKYLLSGVLPTVGFLFAIYLVAKLVD